MRARASPLGRTREALEALRAQPAARRLDEGVVAGLSGVGFSGVGLSGTGDVGLVAVRMGPPAEPAPGGGGPVVDPAARAVRREDGAGDRDRPRPRSRVENRPRSRRGRLSRVAVHDGQGEPWSALGPSMMASEGPLVGRTVRHEVPRPGVVDACDLRARRPTAAGASPRRRARTDGASTPSVRVRLDGPPRGGAGGPACGRPPGPRGAPGRAPGGGRGAPVRRPAPSAGPAAAPGAASRRASAEGPREAAYPGRARRSETAQGGLEAPHDVAATHGPHRFLPSASRSPPLVRAESPSSPPFSPSSRGPPPDFGHRHAGADLLASMRGVASHIAVLRQILPVGAPPPARRNAKANPIVRESPLGRSRHSSLSGRLSIGLQRGPCRRGDRRPIGTPLTLGSTVLPRSSGAEVGMLVVETIAKIRRARFVQGEPIRAICRELRVSLEDGAQGGPLGGERVHLTAVPRSPSRRSAPGATSWTGCWPRTRREWFENVSP